ncbi:hypothetical protein [Microbacterium sp. No. 7]|nr:hypothetical protein [Microbacterium sp. No. 7]
MIISSDLIAGGITIFGALAVVVLLILLRYIDDWPEGGGYA